MKRQRPGFTIVELLTVVAIITLLMSILVPSLSRARRQAKDTNSRANLHSISTALEMFQNERGDYPSSDPNVSNFYSDTTCEGNRIKYWWFNSGMHLLAETLVGRDKMGFDPTGIYDPAARNRIGPLIKVSNSGATGDHDTDNLKEISKAPWNVPASPLAFQLGALVLTDPSYRTPILYYKANRRGVTSVGFSDADPPGYFNFYDNYMVTGNTLTSATGWTFGSGNHILAKPFNTSTKFDDPNSFEYFITDRKAGDYLDQRGRKPYNPDSFLLISAGYDNVYGTSDDIVNWNIPK